MPKPENPEQPRATTDVVRSPLEPVIETPLGRLYRADCLELLPAVSTSLEK